MAIACVVSSSASVVPRAQQRSVPTLRAEGTKKAGAQQPAPAKPATPGQSEAQLTKPLVTAQALIEQGKQLYRTTKLTQALKKFTDALKLEPENDEALGLASITAFRLGHYQRAREFFERRLNLPSQKDSVKAYSHSWMAMSYWREARELLSAHGEIKQDKVAFNFSEKDALDISSNINKGLEHIEQALKIRPDYAEAHNVRGLLHAEAALLASASDEAKAEAERKAALDALRLALKLYKSAAPARETADFGAPTVRIAEFPRTKDEVEKLSDPMMKVIEGGQPIRQVAAYLPTLRPAKQGDNPNDPSATGVTSEGGAYSVGGGRGALSAAYAGGKVKVEVLVSTAGNVVFARVVDGRGDLNGPALAAAKKWKFTPAKFEGQPVQLNGVITFTLKPSPPKPTGVKPSTTPTPAPPKG